MAKQPTPAAPAVEAPEATAAKIVDNTEATAAPTREAKATTVQLEGGMIQVNYI